MRIDVFCLIYLGQVNLEKELLFGMLPPSQPRASLNPGRRAVAAGLLVPGRGKENRNDLRLPGLRLLHAAEVRGWSRTEVLLPSLGRFLFHPGAGTRGFERLLGTRLCKGSAGIL